MLYAWFLLHFFKNFIFTMTFEIMGIHVIDEEMEVQRGDIIFPRSHGKGGRGKAESMLGFAPCIFHFVTPLGEGSICNRVHQSHLFI